MRQRSGAGRAAVARTGDQETNARTSYRQRLFVEHDLGESSGSTVDVARTGYPWPEQMARKMLRNVEKRGVQAARSGPSPPSCVAKAEMNTADRLGSREGSSRAGPPQGRGVSR